METDMGLGRGLLLYILGVPLPHHPFARSLLALTLKQKQRDREYSKRATACSPRNDAMAIFGPLTLEP